MAYIQKNSPLKQRIKGPWPDDTGDKLMKGIGKVGDFGKKWGKEFIKANVGIIKGHYDATKHMITTGTLPTVENMRKSTGPKGPVDTPSSRLPQGKLPVGTTQQSAQKMGLMIKKIRKIPISTTPELPKGTEKSTMGLFNPQPPKKSTSELKVLRGVDLSKDKRDIVAIKPNPKAPRGARGRSSVINQGSKNERLRTKINTGVTEAMSERVTRVQKEKLQGKLK